jgi:hypothetical protein
MNPGDPADSLDHPQRPAVDVFARFIALKQPALDGRIISPAIHRVSKAPFKCTQREF